MYNKYIVKEREEPLMMRVTIEELEKLEDAWVRVQREFDIDDETIARNLGYILIASEN